MREPRPTIAVDVAGKVVNVPVCWEPDRVAAYLKHWPDGVVSLDELAKVPPEKTADRGTHQERCWLRARALELAGKAPSIHEHRAAIAARIAATQKDAPPHRVGQYRRT
jgi:hypothetical protein